MGVAIHYATLPALGLLVALIWRKGMIREWPAFFSFVTYAMLREAVLWAFHAKASARLYSYTYFWTGFVAVALLGWLAGEIWQQPKWGALLGSCAASFACIGLLSHSAPQLLDTLRWAGYGATFAAILAVACGRNQRVATGLAIYAIFPALLMQPQVFTHAFPNWLRYIAPASGLVALVIWLRWAATCPPEFGTSRAKPNRPPSPSSRAAAA